MGFVWPRAAPGTATDLIAARVSPDGVVGDAAGFVVSSAPGVQLAPRAAFNGTNVLVALEDSRDGADWDTLWYRPAACGTSLATTASATAVQLAAGSTARARPAVT